MSLKDSNKQTYAALRRARHFSVGLAVLLSAFLCGLTPSMAKPSGSVTLPQLTETSSPQQLSPLPVHGLAPITASAPSDYFRRQKKIYRWGDQTRFVLVYIATSSFLPDWQPWHMQLVKQAFADWQFALNNRVMFVFMNEPTQADVILSWWNQAQTGVEAGASGLNRLKTWGHFIAENDIYLSLHNNEGRPWAPEEMYPFALHEIGHMLGIQEHSDNPADIMAPIVTSNMRITPRDIATMQRIYTARADYTNPPGVHMTQFNVAQSPTRFRAR
jgi:Matrixin